MISVALQALDAKYCSKFAFRQERTWRVFAGWTLCTFPAVTLILDKKDYAERKVQQVAKLEAFGAARFSSASCQERLRGPVC